MIEQADEGWSVAFEVVLRGGTLWHLRLQGLYDDGESLGPEGVEAAYADWLKSL